MFARRSRKLESVDEACSRHERPYLWGILVWRPAPVDYGRVALGVERAKVLAHALKCHPAVLVFPGWELDEEIAAGGALV